MINPGKYIGIQEDLRRNIVLEDSLPDKLKTVAGVDQSFPGKDRVRSCIVVLGFPGLNEIERVFSEIEVDFPYIPGLLAFREGPSIIKAYSKLENKPDVLLVDGHGMAHPRKMGVASHVGVLLDTPTVGVAKSRLVGDFRAPERVGEYTPLIYQNETVGAVFKSRKGCNPIFISPGNRISLESSIEVVRRCLRGHKLPEPVRLAHKFVSE